MRVNDSEPLDAEPLTPIPHDALFVLLMFQLQTFQPSLVLMDNAIAFFRWS